MFIITVAIILIVIRLLCECLPSVWQVSPTGVWACVCGCVSVWHVSVQDGCVRKSKHLNSRPAVARVSAVSFQLARIANFPLPRLWYWLTKMVMIIIIICCCCCWFKLMDGGPGLDWAGLFPFFFLSELVNCPSRSLKLAPAAQINRPIIID